MPVSVSKGIYHHGKRHRFEVTAADDSPEAFKAALAELDKRVHNFVSVTTPSTKRQSYRKPKGR